MSFYIIYNFIKLYLYLKLYLLDAILNKMNKGNYFCQIHHSINFVQKRKSRFCMIKFIFIYKIYKNKLYHTKTRLYNKFYHTKTRFSFLHEID